MTMMSALVHLSVYMSFEALGYSPWESWLLLNDSPDFDPKISQSWWMDKLMHVARWTWIPEHWLIQFLPKSWLRASSMSISSVITKIWDNNEWKWCRLQCISKFIKFYNAINTHAEFNQLIPRYIPMHYYRTGTILLVYDAIFESL